MNLILCSREETESVMFNRAVICIKDEYEDAALAHGVILYSQEEYEDIALAHGAIICTPEEYENYLMHYRTKGSKNGIRRYQDESGRLTPEGYSHYAELYGWEKKLKKAEQLQTRADKLHARTEKLKIRADEDYVKNYKAAKKSDKASKKAEANMSVGNDKRAAKALRKSQNAAEKLQESQAMLSAAKAEEAKAQNEASEYAYKLQRKEDKIAKYVDESGALTDEALKKYTKNGKLTLRGKMKFGSDFENKENVASKERSEKNKRSLLELNDMSDSLTAQIAEGDIETNEGRKRFGNELFSYFKKVNSVGFEDFGELKNEEEKFGKLRDWLINDVDEKIGSINAGDYYPGTNASKAQEIADTTLKKMSSIEDRVKKEIGYRDYAKDAKRLEKALQKDSTWKKLDAEYEKNTDDVMGAILKDLGFSDTPQNRSMLYAYGWWD